MNMDDVRYQWAALQYWRGCCPICGRRFSAYNAKQFRNDALVWDHWIPKAKGGPDELSNLIPLCWRCNSEKAAQLPASWIVRKFGATDGELRLAAIGWYFRVMANPNIVRQLADEYVSRRVPFTKQQVSPAPFAGGIIEPVSRMTDEKKQRRMQNMDKVADW